MEPFVQFFGPGFIESNHSSQRLGKIFEVNVFCCVFDSCGYLFTECETTSPPHVLKLTVH
jgi:hypothetical protein